MYKKYLDNNGYDIWNNRYNLLVYGRHKVIGLVMSSILHMLSIDY